MLGVEYSLVIKYDDVGQPSLCKNSCPLDQKLLTSGGDADSYLIMAEHLDLDSWENQTFRSHVTRKELCKERNNIYNNINNFGAFNVRGIRNKCEKECLKRDADKYDIDIAAITETTSKEKVTLYR